MLLVRRGFAPVGATKGLSDRPLETFGAHLSYLSFIESFYFGGLASFIHGLTREHSMQLRSTQSRERVKGGPPLRSPEAEPLVGGRGNAPWFSYNTREAGLLIRLLGCDELTSSP